MRSFADKRLWRGVQPEMRHADRVEIEQQENRLAELRRRQREVEVEDSSQAGQRGARGTMTIPFNNTADERQPRQVTPPREPSPKVSASTPTRKVKEEKTPVISHRHRGSIASGKASAASYIVSPTWW